MAGNIGRINTGREQRCDFNIGNHMVMNAVLQSPINLIEKPVVIHGFLGWSEHGIKVANKMGFSLLPGHVVARHEFVDAFEEGFGEDRIFEGEVLLESFEIYFSLISGIFEQALDLRSEDEVMIDFHIVEGLDAEHISCHEEFAGFLIIENEGEHAAESV